MLRIIRSRKFSYFCKNKQRPFSSNISADNAKDASILSSSASLLADNGPSTPSPDPATKKPSNLLKFVLFGTLTGTAVAAGYATYAYTLDEVDEKTKAFRASTNYTVGDNASALDKFQALLYSASMNVPAKAIELYLDLRRSIEDQVRGFTDPSSEKLLPDLHPLEQHVFTLVLDLNETLVYSDWKRERGWRTFKRPGVDAFLEHLAQFYEIVVYSDQPSMYVDPVIERLDGKGCIRYRLSRTATRYQDGKHYRDLSKLNRDPSRILYVSGQALESSLQSENCVPIKPWKLEADDTALVDLIPFLEYVARNRPADIRPVLSSYKGHDIATEFIERTKEHQRRMLEQKQHGFFWRR
ncbi:mitochondrial import inner membrane translocase subunit TIM50-like [Malania oleifera]|uniref:mitochondrial import inner membrane translocase subunit TIM50-like n=1 Tax=Malania oleifera TaxID=397392 RepID=UPI0025AEB0BE|nr:mitochondrial import inner membrane translocase subunit TIM50-like [Malania oleifera]XP_057956030.1 mitochondrial import inner membrane translocase subunit TIM50-like [Malania oleifera]